MNPICIYIANGDPSFTKYASEYLSNLPQVSLVGSSDNAEAAFKDLKQKDCHLIFIDIALRDVCGIELIRRLRRDGITSKIVMLTMVGGTEYDELARTIGADAHIAKYDLCHRIEAMIQSFSDGKAPEVKQDGYQSRTAS